MAVQGQYGSDVGKRNNYQANASHWSHGLHVPDAHFVLWWVVANTVTLGCIAWFQTTLLLSTTLLAIAQWVVIRRYIYHAGWWAIVSSVGAMASLILSAFVGIRGEVSGTFLSKALGAEPVMTEIRLVTMALTGPVGGGLLGCAQWLVLRCSVQRAGWWVVASATGGLVGILVGNGVFWLVGIPHGIGAAGSCIGLLYGIITGWAFVRLLKRQVRGVRGET